MGFFTRLAREIWRDYNTEGVPGSGTFQPSKSQLRQWGLEVEGIVAGVAGGMLVYDTRAHLYADLAHAAGTGAQVLADPTTAYNGIYSKSGSSGSGSWAKIADAPTTAGIAIGTVTEAAYGDPPTVVNSGTPSSVVLDFELPTGATGATGPSTGLDYAFNTATSGDPGSGKVLVNNATPASVTAVNISKTGRNAESLGALIGTWDDSTNLDHRGHLRLFQISDRAKYLELAVTGALTDNTTYWTVPVTRVASGTLPDNAAVLAVMFERTGNSNAGDVTAAANFGTDNRLIRSDGTGKGVQASLVTVSDTGLVTIPGGLEAHRGNDNGVVIGFGAGGGVTDMIAIGFFTGAGDAINGYPEGSQNIFLGRHAGYTARAGNSFIAGHAAAQYTGGLICPTSDVSSAVIIGSYALRNPTQYDPVYAFGGVIIGHEAANNGRSLQTATVVGGQAAMNVHAGVGGCFFGYGAGASATNAGNALLLGSDAGKNATNAVNNVYVGAGAGRDLSRNNTLVIESNATYAYAGTGALIYGEFDNRVLKFNGFTSLQSFGLGAPVTKTADFTVGAAENFLVNNKTGSSCVATLPSASTYSGRLLGIVNYQAQTVVSASSNVVPAGGGSAGTAILAATAGAWALLGSNGTSWVILFSGGTSGGSGVALGDSPTWTGTHTFQIAPTTVKTALGTSTADGYVLSNTTAATTGNQQVSPALHFSSNGFHSTSKSSDWRVHSLPIQQSYGVDGSLVFSYAQNGGSYTQQLIVRSINNATQITAGSAGMCIGSLGGNGVLSVLYNSGYVGEFRSGGAYIMSSSGDLGFTNAADIYGTKDTVVSRRAAGVVLVAGASSGVGAIATVTTTVSGLPSAATAGAGARAFVTDANTPVYAMAVSGGGSSKVPVYSDGSSWLVG